MTSSYEAELDDQTEASTNSTEELEPLMAYVESISPTGYTVISYNRRIIPNNDLTLIKESQFKVVFEMLSDEYDQTKEFTYKILDQTPFNIYLQLYFSRPLEVSQGTMKDRIHITMLNSLFMVEDLQGDFDSW